MIEIVVEHFLTAEGRQRFPRWIHEIKLVARRYPGFIGIRQMTRVDEPDRTVFRLSFRTPQQAQQWIASSDRKGVLALMEPYRLGELQATRWFVGDPCSTPT